MGLVWAMVVLVVLIAVIAFLNRRPSGTGLPSPDSNSSNPGEFTDVSGPADIHFALPNDGRSGSQGLSEDPSGGLIIHDSGSHSGMDQGHG